ncbi:hypothetical protein J6P92_07770, partial [bacterium]|nr:hypothetical protein [bacterium]
MKILNIRNYNLLTQKYNNKNQSQPQIKQFETTNYNNLPTTAQYLSFMGGYSLNLAETVKQLDKFAEKNSGLYPENIREWLGMILENGNRAKETLISVHKKYFASLEDCDTLEQIKALFPEFRGVKSAFDVETAKGKETLISKFQDGKSEYFESDEDLSVQLIKLYWGQGFSLNDLKRYTDGTDLYYTMKKLEIPIASRDYGHVLKFSDSEYNERLTKEMTEKRLAALDRKAQEQDGEPVFIPQHRHLSPEHKQRISEGLHRYYEENPERVYDMSDRQKKFYQENPEKAERLTKVLNIAWNIFNANNIKRAISQHFKRFGITSFDPAVNPAHMTKEQSDIMKLFWANNEWAKKSFSKNMKYAYKKLKNEDEKDFYVEVQQIPSAIYGKLRLTAMKHGINIRDLNFNSRIYINDIARSKSEQKENVERINKLIRIYADENPQYPDDMANTYLMAVYKFVKKIIPQINPEKASLNEMVLLEYLKKTMEIIADNPNGKRF